ncbi:MAG: SpoIIE family protein phosphatase [Leptospiraceae bacterium]|nr:SpoIIE family protein phosphatase [Leptospiraceae bacterium]MCK6379922.1 SpoIIE family protein phosphatase [Leptospiraceae bacterium]NUM41950.1 SpoIIE family protein phosphatase [Leptospiraceae bacterium]
MTTNANETQEIFDYHKAITKKERSSRYIRTAIDYVTQTKGQEVTDKFLKDIGIQKDSSIFKHIYDDENWNSYDLEVFFYNRIKDLFDDPVKAIWEFGLASGSGRLDQKDTLFTFKLKIAPMSILLKKLSESTEKVSVISVCHAHLTNNPKVKGNLVGDVNFNYVRLPEGFKYPHWTSIIAGFGIVYGAIRYRKGLVCELEITHYPNLPSDMPHFNNKVYIFEKSTKNIIEKDSGKIIANAKDGAFQIDGITFNNGTTATARLEWKPESLWTKIANATYRRPKIRREQKLREIKDRIIIELSGEHQQQLSRYESELSEKARVIQEKMDEISALKIQQDGDYYLTSLLTKPLNFNANKSTNVSTDFFIKQKKEFEFRKKNADLGGDTCITGNLKFGNPDNFRRCTMAMNGDAMGKSMQGAGGSLVMGVVMNSIMARSAGNKRIIDTTPEEWLTSVYHETNGVFKSFNGTMILSCVVAIVDDETGEMWYFNAEHPFTVLYRDGKATFIEDKLNLRKLGLDSEIPFKVFKFQLHPGDVIILGSDGRDDINLTPDGPIRTINEDETIFLEHVELGKGELQSIKSKILEFGEITDDLSILRIGFKESVESEEINTNETLRASSSKDKNSHSFYLEAKNLLKIGNSEKAISTLSEGFQKDSSNHKLNKLLGLLSFKEKDYETAARAIEKYLEYDPESIDFLFYFSVSLKRLGKYESSLSVAEKSESLQPQNIQNLVNLADLYRILGRNEEALVYQKKAIDLDPENRNAKKLAEILQKE